MDNRVFYMQDVAGEYSLAHRPTHTFISSHETKEELAEEMEAWKEKGMRELLKFLIDYRYIRLPRKESRFQEEQKKDRDGNEHWYETVWKKQTDKFFEEFPELEWLEGDNFPRELVLEIKKEKSGTGFGNLEAQKPEKKKSKVKPKKKVEVTEKEEKPKKKIKKPEKKEEPKQVEKKPPKVIKKKKRKVPKAVDPFA